MNQSVTGTFSSLWSNSFSLSAQGHSLHSSRIKQALRTISLAELTPRCAAYSTPISRWHPAQSLRRLVGSLQIRDLQLVVCHGDLL